MSPSPIVLFTYNRPEHTLRTLMALKANKLAAQSELFIYVDAPKVGATSTQIDNNNKVKAIVKSQQWCGIVHVEERLDNMGLARSIKSGVSDIVKHYGKIIVLEDDIVTSPSFLTYMNLALDFYQDKPAVFSISGFNYPIKKMPIPKDYEYDTYVALRNCSWGWATWKDRWERIDWEVKDFDLISEKQEIKEALNRMGDDEYDLLYGMKTGNLDIWSVQFTIAHFINHAVAIYPTKSYVDNIGNDGSGENCVADMSLTNSMLSNNESPKFISILYEDKRIINLFYNMFCKTKRPLWQKIINRICREVGLSAPFVLKKKVYK